MCFILLPRLFQMNMAHIQQCIQTVIFCFQTTICFTFPNGNTCSFTHLCLLKMTYSSNSTLPHWAPNKNSVIRFMPVVYHVRFETQICRHVLDRNKKHQQCFDGLNIVLIQFTGCCLASCNNLCVPVGVCGWTALGVNVGLLNGCVVFSS